jgi:hypothetical protein
MQKGGEHGASKKHFYETSPVVDVSHISRTCAFSCIAFSVFSVFSVVQSFEQPGAKRQRRKATI